jgi:hypothetical protein
MRSRVFALTRTSLVKTETVAPWRSGMRIRSRKSVSEMAETDVPSQKDEVSARSILDPYFAQLIVQIAAP